MTAEEVVLEIKDPQTTVKEATELLEQYGLQKQNEVLDKAAEVATIDIVRGFYLVNKQSILNLKNKL